MPKDPSHEPTIEDYLTEERVFPPPPDFRARAVVSDPGVYKEAAGLGPEFWARQAGALDWFRPWDTVLSWGLPFARWFDGGTLNVSYNCLDRHVAAGRGDKVAFHWEGEPGDTRTISYADLLAEVCRFANVLRGLDSHSYREGRMAPELRKSYANLEHVAIARPHFLALGMDMLPSARADEYRAQGMPIVAWTVRSPAEWDSVSAHCDNLIFEGFPA